MLNAHTYSPTPSSGTDLAYPHAKQHMEISPTKQMQLKNLGKILTMTVKPELLAAAAVADTLFINAAIDIYPPFHLVEAGKGVCDYGETVLTHDEPMCDAAVEVLGLARFSSYGVKKGLLYDGATADDSDVEWGKVPPGCSVKSVYEELSATSPAHHLRGGLRRRQLRLRISAGVFGEPAS